MPTDPCTEADLEILKVIRSRVHDATPGPWAVDSEHRYVLATRKVIWFIKNRSRPSKYQGHPSLVQICQSTRPFAFTLWKIPGIPEPGEELDIYSRNAQDDLDFIADARTAIPWLLDLVDRLRERAASRTPEATEEEKEVLEESS